MKKNWLTIGGIALLLALMDQGAKQLANIYFKTPFTILPVFSLRYEENMGIAWSIAIPYALLVVLNIALIVAIPSIAKDYLNLKNRKAQIAMALILGGAMSNLYDRLVLGYVVDYIAFSFWPVFNLADAFLTVGIFLILVFYGKIKRNEGKGSSL